MTASPKPLRQFGARMPLFAIALAAVMCSPNPSEAQTQQDQQQKQQSGLSIGGISSALNTVAPAFLPFGGKTAQKLNDARVIANAANVTSQAAGKLAPAPTPAVAPQTSTQPATPASTSYGEGPVELRPDQKYAVELSIVNVDDAQRPFIYQDMATSLAHYDADKIAKLTKGLEANASAEDKAKAKARANGTGPVTGALSPGDFEFNRAQYEPVIRKAWDAQKKFDNFVNAKLTAYCPKPDQVARYGSAWRYELIAFHQPSATATWNPETDVQVLGSVYAPQDGRYQFDFSKVRYSFDEKAIDAAVKEGCDGYSAKGREFLSTVDPLIAKQDWDGAHKLEMTSSSWVEPIRKKMDATLEKLSPNYGQPVMAALQSGKKVKA